MTWTSRFWIVEESKNQVSNFSYPLEYWEQFDLHLMGRNLRYVYSASQLSEVQIKLIQLL